MKKSAIWLIVFCIVYSFTFFAPTPNAMAEILHIEGLQVGDINSSERPESSYDYEEVVEGEQYFVSSGKIIAETAVVNNPDSKDRLHLRQTPASEGKSLGRYYNGTEVAVLEHLSDGWAYVRIGNGQGYLEGYMMERYLSFDLGNVFSAKPLVTTTVNNLNLRSNPSKGASSIGLYPLGVQVEVMGFTAAWYHVKTQDGQTGFMMAEFLSPRLDDIFPEEPQVDYVVDYAIVNNPNPQDRLHLREKPGRESNSLGKYYNGVQALVLEKRSDGWVHVKIGTLEGYMISDYLAFNIPQANIPSAMPTVTVTVEGGTGKSLNLRSGQSQKTVSIGQFPSGTQVEVMGITPVWYHVKTQDGQTGFMMAEFLTPKLTY